MNCPLCSGDDIVSVEVIRVADLNALYKRCFRLDVFSEFSTINEIVFAHCQGCDLRFFTPPVAGSEAFYEAIQKFNWYYFKDREEYAIAKSVICNQNKVLEVGCGNGAFASQMDSEHYVGLEFSRKAAAEAVSQGLNVFNQSVEDFSKNNKGAFDVVCSFQVVEHVPDVRNFLRASVECLGANGILIVSVPNADSFITSVENNVLNMPPHHVTWWTETCLRRAAELLDLVLVDLKRCSVEKNHKHWCLSSLVMNVMRKKEAKKMINLSLAHRVMAGISACIGWGVAPFWNSQRFCAEGHSVVAIYRKRSS